MKLSPELAAKVEPVVPEIERPDEFSPAMMKTSTPGFASGASAEAYLNRTYPLREKPLPSNVPEIE